jgi:hypothetical protein
MQSKGIRTRTKKTNVFTEHVLLLLPVSCKAVHLTILVRELLYCAQLGEKRNEMLPNAISVWHFITLYMVMLGKTDARVDVLLEV